MFSTRVWLNGPARVELRLEKEGVPRRYGLFVCLFVGWLVGWFVGRLVGRLVRRSVGRSVGRSVSSSVGRLVGRSIGTYRLPSKYKLHKMKLIISTDESNCYIFFF